MGPIFSLGITFQRKSDVKGSKKDKVASQARKSQIFLSSKWNDLIKVWIMTSKGDDLHKI
jgi:hypothetical protein